MLKKKDPYIELLDFYYKRFPESITLEEVYEHFHKKGAISDAELEIIKSFGKETFTKPDEDLVKSANKKRLQYEIMFFNAGQSLAPNAYRKAPHILNKEHYFHRLQYKDMKSARTYSRWALGISAIALIISAMSLFV